MTPTLEITRATENHAKALAPMMRPEDVAEVLASGGYTPESALADALGMSSESFAVMLGAEVAALFGVAPVALLGGVGAVWMLTSRIVDECPVAFLRACRRELPRLLQRWPVLVNAIDARYSRALRWAAWAGFEVGDPVPFGTAGLPFHPIILRRPYV